MAYHCPPWLCPHPNLPWPRTLTSARALCGRVQVEQGRKKRKSGLRQLALCADSKHDSIEARQVQCTARALLSMGPHPTTPPCCLLRQVQCTALALLSVVAAKTARAPKPAAKKAATPARRSLKMTSVKRWMSLAEFCTEQDEELATRCTMCAVFPEDTSVPLEILSDLWGTDEAETRGGRR